jgi:hypothetical protein
MGMGSTPNNNMYQITNPINYNQYGQPIYPRTQTMSSNRSEAFGIASLVLGILTILLCVTMILPVIMGICSIIFGIIQIRKKYSKGLGIAGICTAILGLIITAFIIVAIVYSASEANTTNSKYKSGNSYDYNYDYNNDDSGYYDDSENYDDSIKGQDM